MNISSEKDFFDYLKKSGSILHDDNDINLSGIVLENITFTYFTTTRVKFIKCLFLNCHFNNFEFNGIEFVNSRFEICSFQHAIFMDCMLSDCIFEKPFSNTLLFGMTSLENIEFNDVGFQYTTFSDCGFEDITFNQGWFHIGKFETGDFTYMLKSKLIFNNISLTSVTFDNLDLTKTIFKGDSTEINFINCNLSTTTFTEPEAEKISSIDFFTLLKSETLPEKVLKNIFGITNKNIKEILSHLTTEPIFHSVFISYSFKDAQIGRELKRLLIKNGIKTFFWENDAPGGSKLKKIMIDQIREYDKFLFIASKHSLKSEACHYEILEARNKYNKTWADIFIPIHIDNYLFEIRKEDIPNKFSQTFWENVEELKEFHSLDFTFTQNNFEIEANNEFVKLLNALKLELHGNIV